MDFIRILFDTSDFPARWHCGRWSAPHGWLHIVSDIGIWSAYFAIPCILLYFGLRRKDVPFRKIFFLFGAFILLCGTTHLMEAIIFWWPAYRLAGTIKFFTAMVSWATVVALVPVVPTALAMRSPRELEREILARKNAEEELLKANAELERRVQERTADLLQANSSLYKEREWFRTTLASIGDAVIATDADGRVMFLNSVASSLTGWQSDEAQGHALDEVFRIVNEASRQLVESPVQCVLREGVAVGLANHTVLLARDGTERPIEDSAAPIRDADGVVYGVVLVFRDASEQRKLDRRRAARLAVTHTLSQPYELQEATSQVLRDICQCFDWDIGVCWIIDQESNVLRCDRIWRNTEDDTREFETVCHGLAIRPGASLPGRVWERCNAEWVQDVTKDPSFVRSEAASRCGLHSALACPIFADGTVLGVIEFFSRDIRQPDVDLLEMMSTIGGQIGQFIERKRTEAELREAEERNRSVVENVIDGIITIDERGKIETFNPAAERLLGYASAEVRGKNVKLLVPEPHRSEHDGYIARYLRTGEARIIGIGREVLACRKDGSTFPMELSLSEFVFKGKRHFTGIVRDISERKRNEEELREIAAKLSEADKRKSEFLATLAHELRNPLAPIRSGLEILKMTQGDDSTLRQTRDMMERQTRLLVALVDDLLDVSRITQGMLKLKKRRIQLSDVVQIAVETSMPFIQEAGHELFVSLPQDSCYLEADPNRLAQVISNLLNNAAKYTPERGYIRLTAECQGSDVVVSVKDNGVGIALEEQSQIFELFTQLDRPLEKASAGLGIGLTLVKSLIEMHNGTIEVKSQGSNRGSEFVVRLPALLESRCESDAIDPPVESISTAQLRVLIVDDNKAALLTMSTVVKMLGIEVRTAFDGQEGVAVASEFLPDVILMDIGMPKMNGYEAARTIRLQPWGKAMMLVALTGWGQDEDKRRAKEAGFDYHLVKPAEPSELQRLFRIAARRSLPG